MVVVLLIGGGCNGSDEPTASTTPDDAPTARAPDGPEETVEQLQSGIRSGDWRAVCALGTPKSLERFERESNMSCPEAFESTADQWRAALPPPGTPDPEVTEEGDGATVTYRWEVDGTSVTGRVNLERVDGRWRIDLYEL